MVNNIATVGIVTQPTYSAANISIYGTDYVPASYVRWSALSGIRPIIIPWDAPKYELEALFSKVNGLLLPGGPQDITDTNQHHYQQIEEYYKKIDWIYDYVVNVNQKQYFPLLGICQGFQQIILSASDDPKVMDWNCLDKNHDTVLALEFTDAASKSRMLNSSGIKELDKSIYNIFADKKKPVVPFFHGNAIFTEKFLNDPILTKTFNIISNNFDVDKNRQFVSTIEGKELPIYGVQYHPSFQIYLFSSNVNCLKHSLESVRAMQYLSNFFSYELRKNDNKFSSETELNSFSFDNRARKYIAFTRDDVLHDFTYDLVYFFGPPSLT